MPSSGVMSAVGFGEGGSKECITMERGLNAQESCLSVCPLNRAAQRLNYSNLAEQRERSWIALLHL